MVRKLLCLAPVLAFLAAPVPAQAQAPPPGRDRDRRADHPRLRAALHEMREARAHVADARDAWPPGLKEQALRALDDAVRSVQTILAVKDANAVRGLDRNPDYYKRFRDHPQLRAALQDIRDARDELRSARDDFRGDRERALDDLDVAASSIIALIRHDKR